VAEPEGGEEKGGENQGLVVDDVKAEPDLLDIFRMPWASAKES
jgi:hypothetical protein